MILKPDTHRNEYDCSHSINRAFQLCRNASYCSHSTLSFAEMLATAATTLSALQKCFRLQPQHSQLCRNASHCSHSTLSFAEMLPTAATALSAPIRHELHDRSKIELWEIRRAVSGQLVVLFRKLEITFSVERRCAVCFEFAAFGRLEFPQTIVDISGLPKKQFFCASAMRLS